MLPFTPEQFFGVFADYNRRVVAVAVLWWIATIVVATRRDEPATRAMRLSAFLALLWIWNAVAYHAWLFTAINPAAWFFAVLFAAQSLLFATAAQRQRIEYGVARGFRRHLAAGLVLYGLAYPFLNLLSGHAYPAMPTYGVPCPTVIVTIGLLLGSQSPWWLSVVPIVWAAIGGSAAFLLGVWPDYVLLAAGVILIVATARDQYRTTRRQPPLAAIPV
jgi:hypothetical protein